MAEASDDTPVAAPAEPEEIFSLQLFQTLDQAQSAHGILHQDFAQYHHYLSQRLSRVRHAVAVKSVLVHNHKYAEGVSGRRHAYCSRDESPVVVAHENVIWNLFYQAERAWTHACQLQSQTAAKKNQHTHVQRRLNKAVKFAVQLQDLAARCCDEQTVQECRSYAAWMKANCALEHKKFAEAFVAYNESMTILMQLTEQKESEQSPETLGLRDIWTRRVETVLRPLVRFCQYEAKDEIAEEDLFQAAAVATDMTSLASLGLTLTFRGKDIALESYKQLTVLYLKMESVLADTSNLDEAQFLQLLSDLDDALRLVQQEYSHYESLAAGPAVTAKREELQVLKGYFQYQQLSVSRKQQEARIQELTEDAEIVHVYDALQQNTVAMAALPASSGDENVEEDPFWLEAQAHVARIRAHRCYYLARLYESTLGGTPQEVLALLRQAKQLTARAKEEIAACDMDDCDVYLTALDELSVKIRALMTRAEALRCLQTQAASGGSTKSDRPLWLRLDDLDAGNLLADDPPLTIPMPCKPAFYDVAWQYVGGDFPLDELDECIAAHEPKSKTSFSGGLLSWFGGK
jgi:signal recognition particle subunit SRP68